MTSTSKILSFYPRGALPYMGYIGICGPKGYATVFSAVLVRNRALILVLNGVCSFHSSLELGMFLIRIRYPTY